MLLGTVAGFVLKGLQQLFCRARNVGTTADSAPPSISIQRAFGGDTQCTVPLAASSNWS